MISVNADFGKKIVLIYTIRGPKVQRFWVGRFRVQRPLWPLASSQIEEETNEHRTSNIERRINEFCPF